MALISNILVLRSSGGHAMDLIASVCGEYGLDVAPRTVAQVKLAEWLVTAQEASMRRFRDVPERVATGMLTGEIVPSAGMANWIAEMTEGAVRPHMFNQTPKAVAPLAAEGGPDDRAPDRPAVNSGPKVHRCAGKVHVVGENWHIVMAEAEGAGLLASLQSLLAAPVRMGGGVR